MYTPPIDHTLYVEDDYHRCPGCGTFLIETEEEYCPDCACLEPEPDDVEPEPEEPDGVDHDTICDRYYSPE